MKNKSLWNFENGVDNIYELPKHNSNNYIDIDFVRKILFTFFEDGQHGTESLLWNENDKNEIRNKLINTFCIDKEVVRICFDFDNNLIMVKDKHGKENNIYFLNLFAKKEEILKILNLEEIEMNDIQEDIEAILLKNTYDESTEEEKLIFMKNFLHMQKELNEVFEFLNKLKLTPKNELENEK